MKIKDIIALKINRKRFTSDIINEHKKIMSDIIHYLQYK